MPTAEKKEIHLHIHHQDPFITSHPLLSTYKMGEKLETIFIKAIQLSTASLIPPSLHHKSYSSREEQCIQHINNRPKKCPVHSQRLITNHHPSYHLPPIATRTHPYTYNDRVATPNRETHPSYTYSLITTLGYHSLTHRVRKAFHVLNHPHLPTLQSFQHLLQLEDGILRHL